MFRSASSLELTICFVVVLHAVVNGQCYYPNGELSAEDDRPCSSSGDGPCCPLNWTCLSNGLCNLEAEGYLGRYTCTDQTWESENCPQICTHGNTASGNEAVNKCRSGEYCCDANRPELNNPPGPGCCDTSNEFFPLPDFGIGSPANGSSSAEASSTISTLPSIESLVSSIESQASEDLFPDGTSQDDSEIETSSQRSPSVFVPFVPFITSIESSNAAATSSVNSTQEHIDTASTSSPAVTKTVLLTSLIINSSGSISSIITTRIVEPQSTAVQPLLASTQKSSSNNIGMKVGIGVGIPLGIIVLALLGFFLWRHRKNKKRPEPPSIEKAPPAGALDPEYMYKGNADLGTPATATTVSPDLNKRASSKYVTTDADEGSRYRGIKKAGLGLDTEPPVHELPESTAQDELPGESRELRSSQMSELAGSGNHPAELPGQIHR